MECKINTDIYQKAIEKLEKEETIRRYKQACADASMCYVCGSELKRNSLWNMLKFDLHLCCSKCNEKRVKI